jgi:hypothetical protein
MLGKHVSMALVIRIFTPKKKSLRVDSAGLGFGHIVKSLLQKTVGACEWRPLPKQNA